MPKERSMWKHCVKPFPPQGFLLSLSSTTDQVKEKLLVERKFNYGLSSVTWHISNILFIIIGLSSVSVVFNQIHTTYSVLQVFHNMIGWLFFDPLLNLLDINDHVSTVIKCGNEHLSSLSKGISVHRVQTWGNQNYMICPKHGLRADTSTFMKDQWGLWNRARFLEVRSLFTVGFQAIYLHSRFPLIAMACSYFRVSSYWTDRRK